MEPSPAASARAGLAVWAPWAAGVVALVAALVLTGAIASGPASGMPGVVREGLLWPLRSWDAAWYGRIAERGYPDDVAREWAFLPLWPALLRLGPDGLVGAALVALGSAAAVAGVAASRDLVPGGGPAAARRTAVALVALPGSFALLLAYPDATALACAVWAVLLARRDGRRALGGALLLGVAAALLRPNGLLVALPLLWLWRTAPRPLRLLAGLAPLVAAAAWHAYAWRRTGEPTAFAQAQRLWGRGDGPPGLVEQLLDVPSTGHVQTLAEAAIAVLAVALLGVLWRRGRAFRPWAIYAAAVLALSLGSGSFQSIGRQALLAFPLAWAAADHPRLRSRRVVALGLALNAALILALPLMAP